MNNVLASPDPVFTPHLWNSQAPLGSLDLSTLLEIQVQGKSFLANKFGGWFSNEDQMSRKDAFWAGGETALAREPNQAYTEGMIRVTCTITIDEEEIHQQFIHASGPGGQNVNKVATAVQLRFDVAHSPSLPEDGSPGGTLIKIIKVLGGHTFKFHFDRLKRESNQRRNCMDLQPLNVYEFVCFFELRIARDEGCVFP